MPYCSAVNVAVWQECYARFSSLTETILNIPDDVTIPIGRGESYQVCCTLWCTFVIFIFLSG